MTSDIKDNPEKYLAFDHDWNEARDMHDKAVAIYITKVFLRHDDVTRRQARREFFERIAEYHGFQIIWPTQEKL